MVEQVPFRPAESDLTEPRTYHPVPIPPRGEIVAWLFTLILTVLSAVLYLRVGRLPFWAPLFTFLTLLMALAIRLSRWLEANTSIQTAPEGIHYMSPIREHKFIWDQIKQMSAYQAGNGWRIVVQADEGGFRFQTATLLKGMRGAEVRTGYPDGDEIVGQILRHVDFREPASDGSSWVWQAS